MNTYIKITIEKYSKRILLWKKLIRQGKSALKNRKFSILSIQKKDIYIYRERERERGKKSKESILFVHTNGHATKLLCVMCFGRENEPYEQE